MSFLEGAGAALGGSVVNRILGGPSVQDNMRLGNQLDMENQKEMFDYRIDQGLEYGMTPYEMFMGPAAAGGGGTTGSGQTLGNAALAKGQLQKQQAMELFQKSLDRETALKQTEMQTEAQKEVASIGAGATTYTADLKAEIERGNLILNQDRFRYIDLPQAAKNLERTEQETQKLINEVATTDKKFVLLLKKLSMGVDNMISEFIQKSENFDVTDTKSITRLTPDRRKQLLGLLRGAQSGTLKNIEGLKSFGSNLLDSAKSTTLGNSNKDRMNRANKSTRAMINSGG